MNPGRYKLIRCAFCSWWIALPSTFEAERVNAEIDGHVAEMLATVREATR